MKKILFIFLLINSFMWAQEHLVLFLGQDLNTVTFEDNTEMDLKSTYSFGAEFSMDLGQNFEFGIGAEVLTLSRLGDTNLTNNDKLIPAYFRLDAKTLDNGSFVPYFFITYGKLIADLQYEDGSTTVTAKDGITKSLGLGVKIQNSFKIEIYDGTLENEYKFHTGLTQSVQSATTKIMGIRFAYILR